METSNEKSFFLELVRQFNKRDAEMFMLSPHKYEHHFDSKTLTAYREFKQDNRV